MFKKITIEKDDKFLLFKKLSAPNIYYFYPFWKTGKLKMYDKILSIRFLMCICKLHPATLKKLKMRYVKSIIPYLCYNWNSLCKRMM